MSRYLPCAILTIADKSGFRCNASQSLYFTQYVIHCHIHLPVCLWIMYSHSRAPKKNTSHGNEVLPQDTTHLIQIPCYQRGSPCQDPAGNRTTRNHLTIAKRRKLQWYSHVYCSSGLAKSILQGTFKGERRQGRQRKRWEDNTREWTGLEFTKSQRAVENRENGGNWLGNHLWWPNDPRG